MIVRRFVARLRAESVWRFGTRLHTEYMGRFGTCPTSKPVKCPTLNAVTSAP
jgi:hypothetical protein